MKTNLKRYLVPKNEGKNTEWLTSAKWRKENKEWLDISFSIAVKILSVLKKKGITQKQLAASINCSPQYVNKLLKGNENLQLETIVKLETALDIKLIKLV